VVTSWTERSDVVLISAGRLASTGIPANQIVAPSCVALKELSSASDARTSTVSVPCSGSQRTIAGVTSGPV
jgi:hypothetical protein